MASKLFLRLESQESIHFACKNSGFLLVYDENHIRSSRLLQITFFRTWEQVHNIAPKDCCLCTLLFNSKYWSYTYFIISSFSSTLPIVWITNITYSYSLGFWYCNDHFVDWVFEYIYCEICHIEMSIYKGLYYILAIFQGISPYAQKLS